MLKNDDDDDNGEHDDDDDDGRMKQNRSILPCEKEAGVEKKKKNYGKAQKEEREMMRMNCGKNPNYDHGNSCILQFHYSSFALFRVNIRIHFHLESVSMW